MMDAHGSDQYGGQTIAAQLRAKRQIKLPDALILATAVELRVAEILTFDERWRSIDPRVRLLTS